MRVLAGFLVCVLVAVTQPKSIAQEPVNKPMSIASDSLSNISPKSISTDSVSLKQSIENEANRVEERKTRLFAGGIIVAISLIVWLLYNVRSE